MLKQIAEITIQIFGGAIRFVFKYSLYYTCPKIVVHCGIVRKLCVCTRDEANFTTINVLPKLIESDFCV